jgi:hypothetical protein
MPVDIFSHTAGRRAHHMLHVRAVFRLNRVKPAVRKPTVTKAQGKTAGRSRFIEASLAPGNFSLLYSKAALVTSQNSRDSRFTRAELLGKI